MPFLPPTQKPHQATKNEDPIPPPTTTTIMPLSNKLKDFEAVFPKLVKDLEDNANQYNIPEDALKWYSNVCSFAPLLLLNPHFQFHLNAKIAHSSSHSTTTQWAGNATVASPSPTPPPSSSPVLSTNPNTSSPQPSAGSPSSCKPSSWSLTT